MTDAPDDVAWLTLYSAACDLCEEIRAQGTHECWKQLAHAIGAIDEHELNRRNPVEEQ